MKIPNRKCVSDVHLRKKSIDEQRREKKKKGVRKKLNWCKGHMYAQHTLESNVGEQMRRQGNGWTHQ